MWTVRAQFAVAALVASAALGGLVVGLPLSWRYDAKIAKLKEQHREQLFKGWEAARAVNDRIREQFNEDLALIATRPPGRTVLVCPTGGAVLSGAAAGAGAEAPGGLPPAAGGETGRDLGPFLAAESDRADRCAAQLNGLIDWINKVREPKK